VPATVRLVQWGGVQYGSYGVVCVYGSVVLCTVRA